MNVDESPAHKQDWGPDSQEMIKRELSNALSVHLIPERFHHGIHRILEFINGYRGSTYLDNTRDLTTVMAEEVVNTKRLETEDEIYEDLSLYTIESTMGCLGLGSEFEIFSVGRGDDGAIHMIDTRDNAIPFLMSVVGDHDLGLYVAMRMAEKGAATIGTSAYQEADSLYGHWWSIARLVLEATIPDDSMPVAYERALQRFAELLVESDDDTMVEHFGTSGGFEDALSKLTDMGLLKRRTDGRIEVVGNSAVMFLTKLSDRPLLAKLAANC